MAGKLLILKFIMMKKKIIIASASVLFAVASVLNINMLQSGKPGDVSLDAIAVMAQAQNESGGGGGGTGGVDYSKGYTNNPQPCTVVEYETHQYCFKVYIPWKGQWGVVCEWDYSQRKEYPGTQNFCLPTMGGSGCSYFTCRKNG
jgi:hypothetical protein